LLRFQGAGWRLQASGSSLIVPARNQFTTTKKIDTVWWESLLVRGNAQFFNHLAQQTEATQFNLWTFVVAG
jgi:hypothetical protein